ncbi:MAG TPA: DUF4265 domain-containing protein [Candidatus Acidoferrales bacterium]|nr:DUF4265 domain-containing protein [Candidatus Acidoferrales bacterium]
MEKEDKFVRVIVDLPEPDMGVSGERLWAVPVGNDIFEIRNSPWHARNINWGDWVKAVAESEDKWPMFVSVVKRSGHRTMHVFIHESGSEKREEILKKINELGASYENADGKMYAIDCAPEVDVLRIIRYLDEMKKDGVLDFRVSES